ncbi:MAG: TonB-dependent receptor plug domain-containing protein [Rhodoferax sp.]|nr:TonB-dependent receptor plug domain-containing protein [Rhodoferax sp.]
MQTIVGTTPTDTQERREFIAGKIIIGRRRIEDSGASSVEELLRREPAVSVGSDGRIGLLGLPGYTQILVDGEPPVAGKSLDMNLVRVEKIEIIKSNVAEYGPFGIAGTINVITRKAERKTSSSLRLEGRAEDGYLGETFALSLNQTTEDSPWRFGVQISASEVPSPKEERLTQTVLESGQVLGTVAGQRSRADSQTRRRYFLVV